MLGVIGLVESTNVSVQASSCEDGDDSDTNGTDYDDTSWDPDTCHDTPDCEECDRG